MELGAILEYGVTGVLAVAVYLLWQEVVSNRRFIEHLLEKELEETGQHPVKE